MSVSEGDGKHCHLDCSARTAALKALAVAEAELAAATEARNNAQNLVNDLNDESQKVDELLGNVDGFYDGLAKGGDTLLTNSHVSSLDSARKCLEGYGDAVNNTLASAKKELNNCIQKENAARRKRNEAKQTAANTPCVTICD